MKGRTVFLIATITLIAFGALVWLGWRQRRGVPTAIEQSQRGTVRVPFMHESLQPIDGGQAAVWGKIPETTIALTYQITALPWPVKGAIPTLDVKAFHNGENIYFLLSWQDSTADTVKAPGIFPDAAALMFPLGDSPQPASLMMGFLGKANIWHWKADIDRVFWGGRPFSMTTYSDFYYPFEKDEIFPTSMAKNESAVSDLVAVRVGTITPKPRQAVSGRGRFSDGTWQVLLCRAIQPEAADETDAAFSTDTGKTCAFAVWNGSKGDRGGRKYISEFTHLTLER